MQDAARIEDRPEERDEWLFVAAESEMALLGAILVAPQVYWKVCDRISDAHFYDPYNAMIYREIAGRMMSGTGVSVISMAKALGNQIPDALEGERYFVTLAGKAASSISAPTYADTIRELAIRRELTLAATDAMDACRDLSVENKVEIIASGLEARIHEALTENTSRKRGAQIEEVALRLVTAAEQAAESGKQRGISSGLEAFDNVNGLMMPGDLVVIGGATSMGKTALAQQIVWNAARQYTGDQQGRRETGARVAVFSMEMTAEQYAARHMAQITGIATERMEGQILSPDECRKMREGADKFRSLPMWIEDQRGLTVDRMRSICRRYQHTHGLDLVLIDHLHFIAKADKRMQGLEAIEANVSGLKSMALELDCPVLLISHLNRGLWARDDKRPQLADLHGASAIEKDADAVCFVHREEYWLKRSEPNIGDCNEYADWEATMRAVAGKAEIINGKRRRGRAGETGLCAFDAASTRFYDLARQA